MGSVIAAKAQVAGPSPREMLDEACERVRSLYETLNARLSAAPGGYRGGFRRWLEKNRPELAADIALAEEALDAAAARLCRLEEEAGRGGGSTPYGSAEEARAALLDALGRAEAAWAAALDAWFAFGPGPGYDEGGEKPDGRGAATQMPRRQADVPAGQMALPFFAQSAERGGKPSLAAAQNGQRLPTPGEERERSPWLAWLEEAVEIVEVKDVAAWRAALGEARAAGVCGFDTETTGLDPLAAALATAQIAVPACGAGARLAAEDGRAPAPGARARVYVLCFSTLPEPERKEAAEALAWLLADAAVRKIGHNLKFDLKFVRRALGGRRVAFAGLFDTLIASQLCWAGYYRLVEAEKATKHRLKPEHPCHALSDLTRRHLGFALDKAERASDWSAAALTPEQLRYAAWDAAVLLPLYEVLSELLRRNGLERAAELEFGCLPAVAEMELSGMWFDAARAREIGERVAAARDAVRARLVEKARAAGFQARPKKSMKKYDADLNPASPEDVLEYLKLMGYPAKDTSEETLKDLAAAGCGFAADLLEFRGKEKVLDFIEQWLAKQGHDGRIRAEYVQLNPNGVGRLSCRSPNLQQCPRGSELRRLFRAPAGRRLVVADYSGIELRIMAWLSGDETMAAAFRRGEDLHRLTAASIAGKPPAEVTKDERQAAKACFSGDTEILTVRGWVRFDEYDGETPVAEFVLPEGLAYNPPRSSGNRWVGPKKKRWNGAGRIEFVHPLAFRSFAGRELVHFADRNVDLLVTPDHEIVWIDNNGRPRKGRADSIDGGNLRHFVAAGFFERKSCALNEIETRILAMAVADGSFKRRPGKLTFGFTKLRKAERCRSLLAASGLKFKKTVSRNGKHGETICFTVENGDFVRKLLYYVTPEKDLKPEAALELNPLWYLDEAKHWDSSIAGGRNRDRVFFCTGRRQTADVMQMMCALSSIPSVLREREDRHSGHSPIYELSYRLHMSGAHPVWRYGGKAKAGTFASVPGSHKVYCVQVPSGAIVVRRNGKVVVCGNCNFGLIYGCGPGRLVESARYQYGVDMSHEEARKARERFFDTYRGVARWHEAQKARLNTPEPHWFHSFEKGYYSVDLVCTRTASGRKRVWGHHGKHALAKVTELFNTPDQGTGADMIKRALARVHARLLAEGREDVAIVGAVHDEIILEAPANTAGEAKGVLEAEMAAAAAELISPVPVEVEGSVGESWAEK